MLLSIAALAVITYLFATGLHLSSLLRDSNSLERAALHSTRLAAGLHLVAAGVLAFGAAARYLPVFPQHEPVAGATTD